MMTTIAEKLTLLNSTKTAIAAAIEAKGVTVGSVPFSDYAAKIGNITSGGSSDEWSQEYYESVYAAGPGSYQRPLDWPALPTLVEGDQRVVGLHAVFENDGNFCALSAAGNYTVDWGDGVIEDYAANVVANHTYDFANINLSAVTSQKYKCAVVSITPQSGQSLTAVNLHKKHNQSGLNAYASGFLDITIAGQLVSSLLIGASIAGSAYGSIVFSLLERFRYIGINAITAFGTLFYKCAALKVVELNTANGTSFVYMFYSCNSLQTIPLLDTAKALSCNNMFVSCYSLKTVPLLNTARVTNMSNMFGGCSSLEVIPMLDTAKTTLFTSMFSGCSSLIAVPLLDTGLGQQFNNMFENCRMLQAIPTFNTVKGTSFAYMYSGCYLLESVPQIQTVLCTNFNSMYASCQSLKNIPAIDTSNGTTFADMFQGCRLLQNIPLLDTSKGSSFSNMFNSCASLKYVPALNLSGATSSSSYSTMFNSCPNLSDIDAYGFNYSFTVASCNLSATALNKLYNNLATTTGQTLTVSTNWGTSLDDPSIATAKGWTVSGS